MNVDSNQIGNVIWVLNSSEKSYTIQTNGKITIAQQFSSEGEFHATAVIETTCKQKLTLTRTSNIKFEPLSILWNKILGQGSESDTLTTGIATSDGGFILSGAAGYSKYIVYKINSSGDTEWKKSFNSTTSYTSLKTIVESKDGGYLLGGQTTAGTWLLKINSTGEKIWDKTFSTKGYESFGSLISTNDGGFLIGITTDSGIVGNKSEQSRGRLDFWVLKINSMGIKEWDKTLGGSVDDHLMSLSQTNNGYLIAGYSDSGKSFEKSEASKGGDDYWIVQVNLQGQKVWDKTIGGMGWDYLKSSIIMTDGSIILGGVSYSNISGDKTSTAIPQESNDYWIVKLNTQGQKVWDKTFNGLGYEEFSNLILTNDNNLLLCGRTYPSYSYPGKYFLVKTTFNGDLVWNKMFDGASPWATFNTVAGIPNGYLMISSNYVYKLQ